MPATIVGRCQRFDFRRLTMEELAEHLQKVAAAEGVELDATAAARDRAPRRGLGPRRAVAAGPGQACSAAGRSTTTAIGALLGAPRGEVQHELADAVAVGDVRGAFEIVNRLVQDGQDLRNVTGETLAHFRNLLLVQTAPGQEDLLDIPADAYEALRAQADEVHRRPNSRGSSSCCSPPRTTCAGPPRPGSRSSSPWCARRIARDRPDARRPRRPARTLERLANLERAPATGAPSRAPQPVAEPRGNRRAVAPSRARRPDAPSEPGRRRRGGRSPAARLPPRRRPGDRGAPRPETARCPHAADAGNVDIAMLRRSWAALHRPPRAAAASRSCARSSRAPRVRASTARRWSWRSRRQASSPCRRSRPRPRSCGRRCSELFGIKPAIVCVVRESRGRRRGRQVESSRRRRRRRRAEALRRVQEMLGADAGRRGR